jgi:hypothetical protein
MPKALILQDFRGVASGNKLRSLLAFFESVASV